MIWAVRQVVGEDPAPLSTRGLLPLAGVFAAAAISVLGSTDKLFAAFDLFALGTSILIFIYAASEIRQRRELRLVLGLLIFSAAFQGVIALAQYLTGSTLGLDFSALTRSYTVMWAWKLSPGWADSSATPTTWPCSLI